MPRGRFAGSSLVALRLLAAFGAFAPLAGLPMARAGEDCILDNCADQAAPDARAPANADDAAAPPPPYRARRGGSSGAPGDFDFYVLALSWSPGFCSTPAGARAGGQCDPGAGLGFVVHGLWPQYEHGYPQDCGFGGATPSRVALQGAAGVYPSEGLARYEWRKHGVCAGKSPTDYFSDVRRARDSVAIPPPFQNASANQNWTAIDIERAFIAANRRLRPGMMGVVCARGALREVRICLSKDLRDFRACPEVSRRGCPFGPVSVPPPL